MNQATRRLLQSRPVISSITATGVAGFASYVCVSEWQQRDAVVEMEARPQHQQQQQIGNDIVSVDDRVALPHNCMKEHTHTTHNWEAPSSLEGIHLPLTQQLNNITLHRNGQGLRSIHFLGINVKVYVAGFYTQTPLRTSEEVMNHHNNNNNNNNNDNNSPMVFNFTFLQNISQNRTRTAWHKQLHYSTTHRYPNFDDDVTAIATMLTTGGSIPSGKTQTVQIVGDDTIVIDHRGVTMGRVKGRDFQKAFLSVFFGESAVTEELKVGLLGGAVGVGVGVGV